jgi:hypothetical protein
MGLIRFIKGIGLREKGIDFEDLIHNCMKAKDYLTPRG